MKKKKKKHKRKLFIISSILGILIIVGLFLFMLTIDNIEVTDNKKYSDKEMIDYIFTDKYDYHTLLFYFKSKFTDKTDIPYIETYDIEFLSLNSIRIIVYEKSIVGSIEYMGSYMCFDKDGIVVESSDKLIENIPLITGLDFDYIILNEQLPIKDTKIFDLLLDITQMIKKYKINADKIYITTSQELILYMDNVKVELGTKENLNEKVSDLKDIQDVLSGKSGTLDMSLYNENKTGYNFKMDTSE